MFWLFIFSGRVVGVVVLAAVLVAVAVVLAAGSESVPVLFCRGCSCWVVVALLFWLLFSSQHNAGKPQGGSGRSPDRWYGGRRCSPSAADAAGSHFVCVSVLGFGVDV